MWTINSTNDIRTWVANERMGLIETSADMDRLLDYIRQDDAAPAYGRDWSDYLAALDVASILGLDV